VSDEAAAPVRIGTRGSALALVQARLVQDALVSAGHATDIVIIQTEGDRRAPDSAWGEGAFVAAIERALLDGQVDIAVHSAKDIPTDEDARLMIAAYLPRADPRDALVVRRDARERTLDTLPVGARVGTDSPRRTRFLRACRPDLFFHPLHGNVDTRLRRLDAGETDALVLACAGLDRLERSDRIAERLKPEIVPPAPGQAAIAAQVRAGDERLVDLCRSIDDPSTRVAVEAERAFLRTAGGGCRAPIGVLASVTADRVDVLGGHVRGASGEPAFARASAGLADAIDVACELARSLGIADGGSGADRSIAPRLRVLVTRAGTQAGPLLSALRFAGLDPVPLPAIEIDLTSARPEVDRAAGLLHTADWVVVTSPNGARAVLEAAERVLTDLGIPRWAAIGKATQDVLDREGIDIAFVPSRPTSRAIATELPLQGSDTVVVLRADLAGNALAETLRARGASVDDVIAYRTEEAPEGSQALLRAAFEAGPVAAVIFTSGSTVRGMSRLAGAEGIDLTRVPAICIGETTAEAARAAGFEVIDVATNPSAQALSETVCTALASHFGRADVADDLQEVR
jgi:hydroxymethylbilane synthase